MSNPLSELWTTLGLRTLVFFKKIFLLNYMIKKIDIHKIKRKSNTNQISERLFETTITSLKAN